MNLGDQRHQSGRSASQSASPRRLGRNRTPTFRAQHRLSRAANEPMKKVEETAVPDTAAESNTRRKPDESHRPRVCV